MIKNKKQKTKYYLKGSFNTISSIIELILGIGIYVGFIILDVLKIFRGNLDARIALFSISSILLLYFVLNALDHLFKFCFIFSDKVLVKNWSKKHTFKFSEIAEIGFLHKKIKKNKRLQIYFVVTNIPNHILELGLIKSLTPSDTTFFIDIHAIEAAKIIKIKTSKEPLNKEILEEYELSVIEEKS